MEKWVHGEQRAEFSAHVLEEEHLGYSRPQVIGGGAVYESESDILE